MQLGSQSTTVTFGVLWLVAFAGSGHLVGTEICHTVGIFSVAPVECLVIDNVPERVDAQSRLGTVCAVCRHLEGVFGVGALGRAWS